MVWNQLFLSVVRMSLTASVAILGVLLLRLLLKRAPKIFSYGLWAVVLFRLLCPVSVSSAMSVFHIPKAFLEERGYAALASLDSASTRGWNTFETSAFGLHEAVTEVFVQEDALAEDHFRMYAIFLLSCVWLAGVLVMVAYSGVSFVRLRLRLTGALLLRDNIYMADHIDAPFVMGIIAPKIYLPSGMAEKEQTYVILHEQHHIRRGDHLVKILAYLALCIHWFHPLVWVSFFLSGRDMEMSCDEAVLKKADGDIRADYAASVLRFAAGKTYISALPPAFGGSDTKERVKHVMKYKKSTLWVLVAAGVICVTGGACLASNPSSNPGMNDFSTMETTTKLAQEGDTSSGIPLESAAFLEETENYEELLQCYKQFGITEKDGIFYYNGEMVRYFLDGYEMDGGVISRYKQYNEAGTVDVHTVRNDIQKGDGSTELFGDIVDIVPYSQEEFDRSEYSAADLLADATTPAEATLVKEEVDEAALQLEEQSKVAAAVAERDEAVAIVAEENEAAVAAAGADEEGQSLEEYFADFESFGISYQKISGSQGNIYLDGQLIHTFVDEKPDGSVFITESKDAGTGTVYTVYGKNGKLYGVKLK